MIQRDNFVRLIGEVRREPQFSHRSFDEDFYQFTLCCKRTSGTEDILPILISNRVFNVMKIKSGARVYIEGQLRTFNLHLEEHNKVMLNVFVTDIEETDEPDLNIVNLGGFICKRPVYRVTPLGRRMTDVLLATNRQGGKSSYIPLIVWGRDAKYISSWEVGDYLVVEGRIQSRDYQKLNKGKPETRTTYEVSVVKLITDDMSTYAS